MKAPARFAGTFYPDRPEPLRETVDHLLEETAESRPVVGVLVPHAGYVYSGEAAGAAFGRVRNPDVDALVVIGPSHREDVGPGRVIEAEGFETPLGEVPGDLAFAARLAGASRLELGPPLEEHSLEVQLPFLDVVAPGVPVVAVALGWPDPAVARALAAALRDLARHHTLLVVASSDLSHYHHARRARELDDRFTTLVEAGDPAALFTAWRDKEVEACGLGAVLTLMEFARACAARFEVVARTDSSEAFGEEERVVGYLAGLWVGEAAA